MSVTNRSKQLEKLAMSMPQANQQFAQQQQDARKVQLQSQIKSLPQGVGGPALAQQLGAQQQQQAGQIQLGAAQKTQQRQQVIGQEALAGQARQQRQAGFEQQIALTQNQRSIADKISRIDNKYKNMLLDDQLTFRKDQAGQTLLNERQLADWAISKAKSREEYLSYAQAANQIYQREIQVLEAAHKKISQTMQNNYVAKNKPLDRELRKKLAIQKQELERQILEKKNKAANRSSMWSTGGMIVGGAIGAYFGPAGAVAGAKLGEGLGQTAASQTEG